VIGTRRIEGEEEAMCRAAKELDLDSKSFFLVISRYRYLDPG